MSEIKQSLADVQAELSEREATAREYTQRSQQLRKTLSSLRAQQELDSVDHTQRIEKTEGILEATEAWLSTWPDVRAELNRRIEVAKEFRAQEAAAEREENVYALMETEADLRQQFAQLHLEVNQVALQLREVLRKKEQTVRQAFEAGDPSLRAKAGDLSMPTWARVVGTPEAVKLAEALLKVVAGNGGKWQK